MTDSQTTQYITPQDLFKIDFKTASEVYLNLKGKKIFPENLITKKPRKLNSIEEIIDDHDVFICDGYGVLNFGQKCVSFMPEIIKKLQKKGKEVYVLTNGSSLDTRHSVKKYRGFGYEFEPEKVISSRDVALINLKQILKPETKLGTALTIGSEPELIPFEILPLDDDEKNYEAAEKFLFLSSGQWSDKRQKLLVCHLKKNPRDLFVANPDVTAPFETWFSAEPGFFAYRIYEQTGVIPKFYGKPFPEVYEYVLKKINEENTSVEKKRILMIGDTPFTDILGGNNAGIKTLLLTPYGFTRSVNIDEYLNSCGIFPDFIY